MLCVMTRCSPFLFLVSQTVYMRTFIFPSLTITPMGVHTILNEVLFVLINNYFYSGIMSEKGLETQLVGASLALLICVVNCSPVRQCGPPLWTTFSCTMRQCL
ncbi:hypothetical protein EV361DRAFT_934135 [Lentinula raphanica]|nr:hypothetical protein EV361DRAFT_934135 [Lentinula raphanica]